MAHCDKRCVNAPEKNWQILETPGDCQKPYKELSQIIIGK